METDIHESRVYYNIVEANAMVPRLEFLFSELGRVQREVNAILRRAEEHGFEIDAEDLCERPPSANPVRRALEERLMERTRDFSAIMSDIEDLGVVIEDVGAGSVNFYSWIDGKEVFLSWQTGEPEVGHWHAVTENSIARRSLKHLVKSHRPAEVSLH